MPSHPAAQPFLTPVVVIARVAPAFSPVPTPPLRVGLAHAATLPPPHRQRLDTRSSHPPFPLCPPRLFAWVSCMRKRSRHPIDSVPLSYEDSPDSLHCALIARPRYTLVAPAFSPVPAPPLRVGLVHAETLPPPHRQRTPLASKAELQRAEFTGANARRSIPAATTPRNDSWRTRTPSAASPSSSKEGQLSPGIPMEVDANTLVCYNCYKEGHIARKCTQEGKSPYRKVIVKAAKVAATSSDAGKKTEFVEGSSKNSEKGKDAARIAELEQNLNEMQIKFASLASMISARNETESSGF
ncbi:hypothetical protein FIBSPDRAFT_951138 [Athelia psychrophila]|uniref:CCHC-type domain-containing protein n=1 Tax=Athelia psychrophila TaxID=1759441 RepID=A0A166MVM2_9AGAM|nr:hypothetical protein FIBSPDRAFT_951138 [Fibularhizoctonia sp. CBS 109695]